MFPQRRHIWMFTILVIFLTSSVTITKAFDDTKGVGSFTVTKLENINSNDTKSVQPSASSKTIFRPAVTRTELKVSRSLNHDNVQTLNVRTNNGGVATIIVKKRDGKNSVNNEPRQTYYDPSNAYSRGEIRQGFFGPVMNHQQQQQQQQQDEATKQHQFESGSLYRNWQQPVTLQRLSRNSYDNNNFRFAPADDAKSTELISSFMKHVEKIETGRREQRASSTIDGSIPNDRASVHTNIPEPVTINSEIVYVKDQQKANANKRARSLVEIDSDGIPLINGIRVPDDENDKRQTWRNARVINGELVPYPAGYVPPRTVEYGQLVYPKKNVQRNAEERSRKSVGPFTTADNFSTEDDYNQSIGPFTVSDMFTSRSKNSQQDEGIGPFSVTDNPKYSNTRLIDYIKRINDHEHRKDYFAAYGRIPNSGGQQKIQRRMLTSPGNVYFPPSSKYSNEKTQQVDGSLSEPVLQYAHPEFGLQTVPSEEVAAKNNKKIEYYTTSTTQQQQQQQQQQIQHRPTPPNYYPTPHYQQAPYQPPMYPIEATGNAPLNTREYYNYPPKTPATYPYNYGFIRRVKPERPFWMKISDQVRDTFQSGFSQVHQMARPVMGPIMEAGEKISHNLGFTSPSQKSQVAQEKIYAPSVTSGETTLIFPALGMIAGTAALGLGAVAMGRILDMANLNVLGMRSGELADSESSEEHANDAQARALNAIHKAPTTTLFLVEDNGNTVDHTDDRVMKNNHQQQQQQQQNSNESILTSSSSSSLPPATSTRSTPKAKFIELIAIPEYQQQNISNDSDDSSSSSSSSSIDPSDNSEQYSLTSHQRRKRN